MTSLRVKRITLDSLILGVAMILSYLEAILPLSIAIPLPGVKPGLANVAVMFCFYKVSPADAFFVNMTRVLISSLLFGNISSFAFSASGALLSYFGMWLCLSFGNRVSYYGISVLCAALHNIGQIITGVFILGSFSIISYLPLLLVFSVIFGLVTGGVLTSLGKLRLYSNV